MIELSPQQMQVLESLLSAGFLPISIPLYENGICLQKGNCAATLSVQNGRLSLTSPGSFLIDGNLSVKVRRPGGDAFVWKKHELPATPERLEELRSFREEIAAILNLTATQ